MFCVFSIKLVEGKRNATDEGAFAPKALVKINVKV